MFRDSPDRRRPADLALGLTFSGNTAADCSGYGHVGTLQGNAAITGKVLSLDGAGDYLSVPDAASLDMPSAWSAASWFEPSTPGSTSRVICGKYNATGNLRSYYIVAGYGVGYWDVVVSATGGALTGTSALNYRFNQTIPTSGWHHVVTVVDTNAASGSRIRLWVDGVELSATVVNDHSGFTPFNVSLPLEVGSIASGTLAWKGNLDDFFLFRRALTANEAKQLYYRGRT